jgi:hypothetical protein
MEAHIRRNELLTVFQSGFRRYHSTTAAVLKVTDNIRSNMENGQVTVLVLLESLRHLIWLNYKVIPRVRNLGFVLNGRLTATDHFRKVCQRIYWILRSLRPHAHTPFEVSKRHLLSLILPHVNYGNIVFTGADFAEETGGSIQGLFALYTYEETT